MVGVNPIDTTMMTTSTDPYDPSVCPSAFGSNSNDVWYSYTATISGESS